MEKDVLVREMLEQLWFYLGVSITICVSKYVSKIQFNHFLCAQSRLRSCPLGARWPHPGWRKCACPAAQWENPLPQLNGPKTGQSSSYATYMSASCLSRTDTAACEIGNSLLWGEINICNLSVLCQWGLCHSSDSRQSAADLIQRHTGATFSQSRGFWVLHLYGY